MILVTCTITLLSLSLPTGIYASSMTGQLNVISQNQTIQIFDITEAGDVFQLFSAQLELDLRSPCPFCHPTYNLFTYGDQVILPSAEVLNMFTFIAEPPYVYTQSVQIPDCIPLSFTASVQSVNLLFMDCEDLVNEGNYFLAKLQLEPAHHWVYYKLRGFETVGRAGAYTVFTVMDIVMMMYVHEQHEYIELNDVRSGYFNSIHLPDHCVHAVRISATGKNNLVLIECSSSKASDQVSSIYTLESATFTHLLDTAPYSICPIRFTEDGSTTAIFTEYYIIAIDLNSAVFINVSVNQAIYDGIITQFGDDSFYLVYSTPTGLHRVSVNFSQEMESSRLGFTDTSGVCVVDGCSLLTLVDSNTILVAIGLDITLLSISDLSKVAPNVEVKYRPSRNIFQKINITTSPSGVSHDDDENSNPTSTMYVKTPQIEPTPTEKPDPTTSPSKPPIKDTTKDGKKDGTIVKVMVPVVIAIVAVVVVVALVVIKIVRRRHYHRKKSLFTEIRYSDCTQLLTRTPPPDNDIEEREGGVVRVVAVEELESDEDERHNDQVREHSDKQGSRGDNDQVRGEHSDRQGSRGHNNQVRREHSDKQGSRGDNDQVRGEHSDKQGSRGDNDQVRGEHSDKQGSRGDNDQVRREHSDRQGSRAPPRPIPLTNIGNECGEESPTTPLTPLTEFSSKAVHVLVTQESCTDARFDARQQQVVGSLNKETQEVRESPDGCNSSQS